MSTTNFTAQWQSYQARAEQALNKYLPNGDAQLEKAMRYSCLQGGKRFRAMLVYAAADAFDTNLDDLDAAAATLEMLHAYSLIHDDLPAMDDDDLRRGKPSCHIQFGEAMAILAGDALQSLAFEVLAQTNQHISTERQLAMLQLLAKASGVQGMAGGQALDMQATGQTLRLSELQNVHEKKTGALIRAAIGLGALAAKKSTVSSRQALDEYGHAIGLAFQVTDDILDQTQNSETLGKQSGADERMQKNSYPALIGLQEAQEFATNLHQQALLALDKLAQNDHNTHFLRQLATFTINREY